VSYSITTNKTAYNEGETLSISVTAPAADGSTLYWTIEDVTTGIDISPTTLPNGIKGGYANEAYQPVQLTASGGTGPYTFSVVVGSLPAGLTLSSAGSISGFPTSAGVTTFTVQAIDSQGNGGIRQYSLSVANVTYLPATLPNGTQGIAYSQQLSVSGGVPTYVYQVMGSLPAGLTLSSSGLLSGTPTVSGTFNTSIRAIFNGGSLGDPGITIFYQDWIIGTPVNISVNPSNLATGAVNASYSQQLTASGGTSPYTYSTSSALPTGVTLSSSGLLSGTPTQAGNYTLAIQVNDNAGASSSVQRTLNVTSVTISISPSSLPSATLELTFSQQLTASGGTGPYTYSSTGSLPNGLSLTQGGLLSGTPVQPPLGGNGYGTFSIEIVANDANSNAGSKTYSLTINDYPATIISGPSTLTAATRGSPYSQQLTASGGTGGPYTFSESTNTPNALDMLFGSGLSVSTTGLISGTPNSQARNPLRLAFQSLDAFMTAKPSANWSTTKYYELVINDAAAPTISISPLASTVLTGTQNVSYSQAFTASGGTPSYTFSAIGQLPPGLSLVGGLLLGMPTSSGTFGFTIQAVDANNNSGTATYSLVIAAGVPTRSPFTISVTVSSDQNSSAVVYENSGSPYALFAVYAPNDGPRAETLNWTVTGVSANDFASVQINNGAGSFGTNVTVLPSPTLSGTLYVTPQSGSIYSVGTIKFIINPDGLPEGIETMTFTVKSDDWTPAVNGVAFGGYGSVSIDIRDQ
jgi:hypothetical protein